MLRGGPQHVSGNTSILVLLLLAGLVVDSFATVIIEPKLPVLQTLTLEAIHTAVLLLVVALLLWLTGYRVRIVQTLASMVGVSLLISLVLLPALLVLNTSPQTPKPFGLVLLMGTVWRVAVNMHIFRHALSVPPVLAAFISISFFLLSVWIAQLILPEIG